jgi:hypothetical protein
MTNMHEGSPANDFGSQARFVAAAKRSKPIAWKRVELLRAACALPPALSFEQSVAMISLPISASADCFGFDGVEGRAHRSVWC